mmetsp:Transcript_5311/g.11144  ORF Transcript_5311/g.11144 Transcript_5311/m.11144 type:complete len:92 (-) Transcript_5311:1644-1919(-)
MRAHRNETKRNETKPNKNHTGTFMQKSVNSSTDGRLVRCRPTKTSTQHSGTFCAVVGRDFRPGEGDQKCSGKPLVPIPCFVYVRMMFGRRF